jgi:hypothetical protein
VDARSSITEVRTELWYVWAEIAIDAEFDARVARDSVSERRQDGAVVEVQMEQEVKAVLIATTAASHALDAFFNSVAELGLISDASRATWKKNGVRRRGQILETLAATFEIGKQRTSWNQGLEKLFEIRKDAVHYEARPGPLIPHPVGVTTTPVAGQFALEEARSAVDLMLEIITTCIRRPRPVPAAIAWSRSWSHADSDLNSRREGRSNGPGAPG